MRRSMGIFGMMLLLPVSYSSASHWDLFLPVLQLETFPSCACYCVPLGFTHRTSKLVLKNGHLDILRHSGVYTSRVQISAEKRTS